MILPKNILVVSDHEGLGSLLSQVLIENKLPCISINYLTALDSFHKIEFSLVIFCDNHYESNDSLAIIIREKFSVPYLYLSKRSLNLDLSQGFNMSSSDIYLETYNLDKLLNTINKISQDFYIKKRQIIPANFKFTFGALDFNSRERVLFNFKKNIRFKLTLK